MNDLELRDLHAQLRALHAQLRRTLPPVDGVSSSAVRVLGVIARAHDAGARPNRIAAELTMTSSNVAAALGELDRAGLIVRRRDTEDARGVCAFLTSWGADFVEQHRTLRTGGLREAIERALTTAEQLQLAAVIPLLGRIVEAGQEASNR